MTAEGGNTIKKQQHKKALEEGNVRKFSLRFQSPKLFNSFNNKIQNASSIAVFTSKLVIFLGKGLLLLVCLCAF